MLLFCHGIISCIFICHGFAFLLRRRFFRNSGCGARSVFCLRFLRLFFFYRILCYGFIGTVKVTAYAFR